jgi:hypothetical protein
MGELVKLLSHPNRWWRLQAQRLILERQDFSIVPDLITLFNQSEDPKVRLHAFYALEGLNSLPEELVKKALKDASPGLREHGLIVSERFPDCLEMALAKIDDPNIQVAYQATLTAGNFHGEKVVTALAHAITKYGPDPWFQTAVLSSEEGSSVELLKLLLAQHFFSTTDEWKFTFLETYAHIAGARNQKEQIIFLLNTLSLPEMAKEEYWREAVVNGLSKGLKKSITSTSQIKEALTRMEADSTAGVNDKINLLHALFSAQPILNH